MSQLACESVCFFFGGGGIDDWVGAGRSLLEYPLQTPSNLSHLCCRNSGHATF